MYNVMSIQNVTLSSVSRLFILAATTDGQNVTFLVPVAVLLTSQSWVSWLHHIDLLPRNDISHVPCYYPSIMLKCFWLAIIPILCSA